MSERANERTPVGLHAAFCFFQDRSGAIGLDEMENAIQNLGMDPKLFDLESLIREADKRGNHQIDFDEFAQASFYRCLISICWLQAKICDDGDDANIFAVFASRL